MSDLTTKLSKPIYTKEEEQIAFTCYAAAKGRERERIRDEILAHNIPMVQRITGSLTTKYKKLSFDDVYSNCIIGAYNAIDKFRVERGFKFSTYFMTAAYRFAERLCLLESRIIHLPL